MLSIKYTVDLNRVVTVVTTAVADPIFAGALILIVELMPPSLYTVYFEIYPFLDGL